MSTAIHSTPTFKDTCTQQNLDTETQCVPLKLVQYSLRTNNRLTTWPLALAHPRALSSALCSLLPSLCLLSVPDSVGLTTTYPLLNDVSVPPRASLGANKTPLAVGLYTRVVVAMKLTLGLSTSGAGSRLDDRRSSLAVGGPNPWYCHISMRLNFKRDAYLRQNCTPEISEVAQAVPIPGRQKGR